MFRFLTRLITIGKRKNFDTNLTLLTKENIKLTVEVFIQSEKTKENVQDRYQNLIIELSDLLNEKTSKLDLGSVSQIKFNQEITKFLEEKGVAFGKVSVYGINVIDKVGEEATVEVETLRRRVEENSVEIDKQFALGLMKIEEDSKMETINFYHKLNLERMVWANQECPKFRNPETFKRYILAFDYLNAINLDCNTEPGHSSIFKAIEILENKSN